MLRSRPFQAQLAVSFLLLTASCADDAQDGGSDADGGAGGGSTADGGTGGGTDTDAPTVVSSFPIDEATGETTTLVISATFSEAMDPLTMTNATFTLERGAVPVPGAVTYYKDTVVLSPESDLELGTTYTATISSGATDVAGNALAKEYTWTFTTDLTAPVGPSPVFLGAAGDYAILAKSAISNVPTSIVTGDVGLSPAAASYITGFALTKAGTSWTSPQVTGGIFAADNDPPTPSELTIAIANMEAAYTDAAGRPTPEFLNLGDGAIGGLTLAPGLYRWSSSVTIPSDVTIAGAPNDTWIFQITGDLDMAAAQSMILSGGARAKNIVWQVAGFVVLGTGAHAEGIVLSETAITAGTGSSINGRLLAQTAVNLAGATIATPLP